MQMKAAVLHEIGLPRPYAESRPLHIETLQLDPPGAGEILVRVRAAGLCHSDLSVINGDRPRPMPMALGHEAAGEVLECGPGVEDLQKGDHVVMVFVPSCGHCLPCAEGRPALCEPGAAANGKGALLSGGHRLHDGHGHDVNHHVGVSAFAEYAVLSRSSVVKIDKELPWEQAALFGCAVLTGVGAVVNTAQMKPGTKAAVIGLGGVGLNSLLGAILCGAEQIVAIDLLESKLDMARQLGATDAFNAKDADIVEKVREATKGGVDYAFEMAGSVPALELAYKITKRGGMTVTAGLANPTKSMSLSPVVLVAEERTLKGSYVGGCVPLRDIPRYIEMFRRGRLPVDRLLSERIEGLEGINAAFDRLADGVSIRQVIIP
ncbi:MAG: zinc-dependent alcohol dehydrogenase family protein [Alphaproteobacteria bacterium]|nr:zinc-dependent alcohol dehydrogenase family protein [Alphaproteobacteria bacterium]MBU0796761.1 zinc-dependent alcohol dehydrogenase family protein [Alphaproteobacteria bacterium]MBU0888275.1 zinc-dependent alcohol dehydrogenase family protein [Alphaproteobacteria bacterium]MBU1811476.1 zinc-dependent alcohol dehydrogenase family protein [Alphaproteobacteria bacterium]MBU2089497.1 zinc-dependent alcohol dehydrogenase family protein [Alphaproteobacteria bacterium]